MSRATITRPIAPPKPPPTAPTVDLGTLIAAASDTVSRVAPDDPRWEAVGPPLTAFVDAARRAAGRGGSPIGADEAVPAVLRLRDLARVAQMAATRRAREPVAAVAEAEDRLRSLQVAALR